MGPLHDKLRKHKNSPRKTSPELENLIISEAKKLSLDIAVYFRTFIENIA